MFFERNKVYQIKDDNFTYVVKDIVKSRFEIENFDAFLKVYNKSFSNNHVKGKIKRKQINAEVAEFTYTISVDKRYILNTVFFTVMECGLGMVNENQENYKKAYDFVRDLIVSTCNKVETFEDIDFEEDNKYNLTIDEQTIYQELFKCIDQVVDVFYSVTFEGALCNKYSYDF